MHASQPCYPQASINHPPIPRCPNRTSAHSFKACFVEYFRVEIGYPKCYLEVVKRKGMLWGYAFRSVWEGFVGTTRPNRNDTWTLSLVYPFQKSQEWLRPDFSPAGLHSFGFFLVDCCCQNIILVYRTIHHTCNLRGHRALETWDRKIPMPSGNRHRGINMEANEEGDSKTDLLCFMNRRQESNTEGDISWNWYSEGPLAVYIDFYDVLCLNGHLFFLTAFPSALMHVHLPRVCVCLWIRLNYSSALCVTATRASIIDVLWCRTHYTKSLKILRDTCTSC